MENKMERKPPKNGDSWEDWNEYNEKGNEYCNNTKQNFDDARIGWMQIEEVIEMVEATGCD